MWSTGAGADVMKRIAAPMVGGLVTSFLMELLVYPAVYLLWKTHLFGGSEGAGWWCSWSSSSAPATISGSVSR
jgi:hypothetical protein